EPGHGQAAAGAAGIAAVDFRGDDSPETDRQPLSPTRKASKAQRSLAFTASRCCSGWGRCLHCCSRKPVAKKGDEDLAATKGCGVPGCLRPTGTGQFSQLLVTVLGLTAVGSLLAALLDATPHLLAAALSAVLGWLALYAYMLQ
ncbi:unnamed protein product, partial [Polarella glacialis]